MLAGTKCREAPSKGVFQPKDGDRVGSVTGMRQKRTGKDWVESPPWCALTGLSLASLYVPFSAPFSAEGWHLCVQLLKVVWQDRMQEREG